MAKGKSSPLLRFEIEIESEGERYAGSYVVDGRVVRATVRGIGTSDPAMVGNSTPEHVGRRLMLEVIHQSKRRRAP